MRLFTEKDFFLRLGHCNRHLAEVRTAVKELGQFRFESLVNAG